MSEQVQDVAKELGLYVHIPFCRSKCHYCDFNSYTGKESLIPSYFDALKQEISYYSGQLADSRIKTVFIGGGTPSLPEVRYINELMQAIRHGFNFVERPEVSMEANPGTLTKEKLFIYKNAGINRLSIGLQAWQDSLLRSLGRIHCADEFVKNFESARQAGFDNINVDLIFGLPGQTMEQWEETIRSVIGLGADHISCYSLKIEEGTVFGSRFDAGELIPADDELDRQMYWFAVNELKKRGYGHYEISNFARRGFECRHNLIYWKAEEYLGLGAGAHSYLDGKRFNNTPKVESYINSVSDGHMPMEEVIGIDRNESMKEFMLLGLRLVGGVSAEAFRARFGEDMMQVFGAQFKRLEKKGLLERHSGIRLSKTGLDMANQAFMEFI